ncbi:thymosin beta-4-like [Lontra canadensis]|uniref:thymosin beta-4-like n=1 Tax=Lontra canadensis TaxID=76717 RepID=UPI0013F2BE40|nr:thymosin beta-4-like [Lontra canadensis]
MLDKPNITEIEKCAKSKLKTEIQEKNPVPSEGAIEQMKQAGKLMQRDWIAFK